MGFFLVQLRMTHPQRWLTGREVLVPFVTLEGQYPTCFSTAREILTFAVWRTRFFFFCMMALIKKSQTLNLSHRVTSLLYAMGVHRLHLLSTWWAGCNATTETPLLKQLRLGTSWGSFEFLPVFIPTVCLFQEKKLLTSGRHSVFGSCYISSLISGIFSKKWQLADKVQRETRSQIWLRFWRLKLHSA